MNVVSANKSRLSPKCPPTSYESHVIFWTPPWQQSDGVQLKMSLTVRFKVTRSGAGIHFCFWCWFHISQNRVANYQGWFLIGWVAEWGNTVSDMKRLVVNHEPLFWATLPLNGQPTTLITPLLGDSRGKLTGAKLGQSAQVNCSWLAAESTMLSRVRSRASCSASINI